MDFTALIAKTYRLNLLVAVIEQVVLLFLGALALDGGQFGCWVIYAIGIYWIMALGVMIRRPHQPTKVDRLAIRYGFILILIVVISFTSLRWAVMGVRSQ